MATLSPSGLKTTIAGEADWDGTHDDNFTLLNNTLLKLSALFDVDVTGLNDGDILVYNNSTHKWEPEAPTEPIISSSSSLSSESSESSTESNSSSSQSSYSSSWSSVSSESL